MDQWKFGEILPPLLLLCACPSICNTPNFYLPIPNYIPFDLLNLMKFHLIELRNLGTLHLINKKQIFRTKLTDTNQISNLSWLLFIILRKYFWFQSSSSIYSLYVFTFLSFFHSLSRFVSLEIKLCTKQSISKIKILEIRWIEMRKNFINRKKTKNVLYI